MDYSKSGNPKGARSTLRGPDHAQKGAPKSVKPPARRGGTPRYGKAAARGPAELGLASPYLAPGFYDEAIAEAAIATSSAAAGTRRAASECRPSLRLG